MPITAQFINKRWFSQYFHGENIDINLNTPSNNLQANKLEKVKLISEVLFYQVIELNDFFIYFDFATNEFSLKCDSADLSELNVGDEIAIIWQQGTTINAKVSSVSDNLIYCYDADNTPLLDSDGTGNNGYNHGGTDYLVVTTPIDYVKYKWGLNDSNGSSSTASKLDGRTKSFELDGITTTQEIASKLNVNDNDDRLRVRRLPNTNIPDNEFLVNSINAQVFEFEHIFIVDDYTENDISSILEGKFPERYLGELTQNYYNEIELRSVATNPETAKIISFVDKSNVGYSNERFNDGLNPFTVSDVELTININGDTVEVDNLSSTKLTRVSFRVDNVGDLFAGGFNYHVIHKTLRTAQDYQQSNVPYTELFDYDNVINDNLDTESGTIITNLAATSVTDSTALVEFDFQLPNSREGESYETYIVLGDWTTNNVNRMSVTVPITVGTYYDSFDIDGLLTDLEIKLIPRNCDVETSTGFDQMEVIKADLLNTKFTFNLFDGEIRSIKQVTASFIDGDFYLWRNDSLTIPTSDIQLINGQQLVSKTYDAPYPDSIGITIEGLQDNSWSITAPYIVPYDELINEFSLTDRPSDLYNPTKPNNGYNQDVIYQQDMGANIHMGYLVTVRKGDKDTDYLHLSGVLTINDFEEKI